MLPFEITLGLSAVLNDDGGVAAPRPVLAGTTHVLPAVSTNCGGAAVWQ